MSDTVHFRGIIIWQPSHLFGCHRFVGAHPMHAYLNHISVVSRPFEVFSLSMDLGNITATTEPIVWSLGVVRDIAVNYTTGTGILESRVPYFKTQYPDIQGAVGPFTSSWFLLRLTSIQLMGSRLSLLLLIMTLHSRGLLIWIT